MQHMQVMRLPGIIFLLTCPHRDKFPSEKLCKIIYVQFIILISIYPFCALSSSSLVPNGNIVFDLTF